MGEQQDNRKDTCNTYINNGDKKTWEQRRYVTHEQWGQQEKKEDI